MVGKELRQGDGAKILVDGAWRGTMQRSKYRILHWGFKPASREIVRITAAAETERSFFCCSSGDSSSVACTMCVMCQIS